MAIDDARARERYDRLRMLLSKSSQHIEWLLPFLDAKARQSGDVAGLQMNARQHINDVRLLFNSYDGEDAIAARDLAQRE